MAGMWIARLGVKGSQEKLRSEVWSSLPDDLLDIVISQLPPQSLVRMTSVCKIWKIKIRTPSFICQCELQQQSSPGGYNEWFLTFGQHKNAFAYDLHLSKWHHISLGFLPFKVKTLSPLAAADGLLCLRGSNPDRLVVCNPLSRFWRDVPLPPHDVDPSVVSLVVDRVSGRYKLVIVTQSAAIVFESQSLTWSSYSLELGPSVICSAICEGIFYCLTAHELLAFNVEWTKVRIALPADVVSPRLVARSSGRLFLVGAYRHKSQSARIWELDHETRRWSVVDILLEASLRASKCYSPDVIAYVKWSSRFLAYDVSKKAWLWLPRAHQGSFLPCKSHGFFFTPSLLLP